MTEGFFLVLEGIDGSGTTTQAQLLGDFLKSHGKETLCTREPTDGPAGRLLREALGRRLESEDGRPLSLDWTVMALLFSADRMDHVVREVQPALRRGAVVICDRYVLSSLIYQSLTSREGAAVLPWLEQLNARARRPDCTIVLQVDPDEAAARRKKRSQQEEIYEADELQRRLAREYGRASEILTEQRVVGLSGEGTPAEVAERIREALASFPEFAWMGTAAS